jgi:hypothetical protein
MREKLSADELRNIERGTHIVVRLHEDEYWMMGEGEVEFVTEYDSGAVHVGITPLSGPQHTSRLKIPADAREGLRFTGVAGGAKNLRVDHVYKR